MAPAWAEEAGEERVLAGIRLVKVPEGCFNMGSPASESGRDEDEGPVHEVCLDGFWMGRYEVTQKEWMGIMGRNPAHFNLGENHPVEQVSWKDVQGFMHRINARQEGQCRLPTEAEWEYGARGGTKTPFHYGDKIHANIMANFNGKDPDGDGLFGVFRQSTLSAGRFPANPFGLYDMHGNVSEWVLDWYCEKFYQKNESKNKNPICRDDSSGFHVLRGGSWYDVAKNVRSADRGWSSSDNRHASIGFRVVCGFGG